MLYHPNSTSNYGFRLIKKHCYMITTWTVGPGNELHKDFEIYSTCEWFRVNNTTSFS